MIVFLRFKDARRALMSVIFVMRKSAAAIPAALVGSVVARAVRLSRMYSFPTVMPMIWSVPYV